MAVSCQFVEQDSESHASVHNRASANPRSCSCQLTEKTAQPKLFEARRWPCFSVHPNVVSAAYTECSSVRSVKPSVVLSGALLLDLPSILFEHLPPGRSRQMHLSHQCCVSEKIWLVACGGRRWLVTDRGSLEHASQPQTMRKFEVQAAASPNNPTLCMHNSTTVTTRTAHV